MHEGVEQPHLDARVSGQMAQRRVQAQGVEIVHQQAHAHAARGRVAQLTQDEAADRVVANLVDVQIYRALRMADELHPGVQRMLGLGQAPEARLARPQRRLGRKSAQWCGGIGGQRLAECAWRGLW